MGALQVEPEEAHSHTSGLENFIGTDPNPENSPSIFWCTPLYALYAHQMGTLHHFTPHCCTFLDIAWSETLLYACRIFITHVTMCGQCFTGGHCCHVAVLACPPSSPPQTPGGFCFWPAQLCKISNISPANDFTPPSHDDDPPPPDDYVGLFNQASSCPTSNSRHWTLDSSYSYN